MLRQSGMPARKKKSFPEPKNRTLSSGAKIWMFLASRCLIQMLSRCALLYHLGLLIQGAKAVQIAENGWAIHPTSRYLTQAMLLGSVNLI
jgi:hypothetical protein